jgi:hypothetical protein
MNMKCFNSQKITGNIALEKAAEMLRRRNQAPNSEKGIIQPTEKDRIFNAKKPLLKSITHKKKRAKREKRQRTRRLPTTNFL